MLRILTVFRWETQNALRESELRFRTIATTAPVIFFTQDQEGLITFLEGKDPDALRLESGELIGK
jgi:PAS domain-containing protein